MNSKRQSCITGEEKPEIIQTKEGGLMYLEKSRRVGYSEAAKKLSENLSELNESEMKAKNPIRYIGLSLDCFEQYFQELKKLEMSKK